MNGLREQCFPAHIEHIASVGAEFVTAAWDGERQFEHAVGSSSAVDFHGALHGVGSVAHELHISHAATALHKPIVLIEVVKFKPKPFAGKIEVLIGLGIDKFLERLLSMGCNDAQKQKQS